MLLEALPQMSGEKTRTCGDLKRVGAVAFIATVAAFPVLDTLTNGVLFLKGLLLTLLSCIVLSNFIPKSPSPQNSICTAVDHKSQENVTN